MPPPRTYRFLHVDVFTDRVFGGNPLAVFPDPEGLSDVELQAIAREMNLAETTFVYPPSRPDAAARVRIFTPNRELPFAGHPTIGTAYVLANMDPALAAGMRSALEPTDRGPRFVFLARQPVLLALRTALTEPGRDETWRRRPTHCRHVALAPCRPRRHGA